MNAEGRRRGGNRKDPRNSRKQKLFLTAAKQLESNLGFDLFSKGDKRLGWLLTFASDCSTFKSKYKFRPYFYVATKDKMEMDVRVLTSHYRRSFISTGRRRRRVRKMRRYGV